MKKGEKILVEMWNPNSKKSDWVPGILRGYVCGDLHEDFERVNVTLYSGTEIDACHPNCVKKYETTLQ